MNYTHINNDIEKNTNLFYPLSGSAMPEVRGTAEPHDGAYPVFAPFARTPSRHSPLYHC